MSFTRDANGNLLEMKMMVTRTATDVNFNVTVTREYHEGGIDLSLRFWWKDGWFFGQNKESQYALKGLSPIQHIEIVKRILSAWENDRSILKGIAWQESLVMEFVL